MASFLKTARFRISLWNACGVAGIALAALLAIRQGVWWTMLQETDDILAEDAREIELALKELPQAKFSQLVDELRRKALGHKEHEWFVLLVGPHNTITWQSEKSPVNVASLLDSSVTQRKSVADVRLLMQAVDSNVHDVSKILVGASIEHIRADLSRIDRLVGGAAIAILLLSPVFGYLLAGRAMKDVHEISATAERLKPAALNERLPIRGSGDEFDRLALTINSLLDRIAIYISQKRDFLADAAHELRTPLAAIHSSIEVALTKPRTPEEYRQLLEDVMEEGEALELLVNQLLLMSEAAAQPHVGEPVEVNLSEIVTKSADMFSGVADANDIKLTAAVSRGIFVLGSKAHLRQLVNNLLDNAIKYSLPKSQIRVTLALNAAEQAIVLSVADTGLGIPTKDLPQLFDRFFRVDRSRSREIRRGTGLGLAICKTIVEAHGGSITCESTEGKGTTMTVRMRSSQHHPVVDGQG